MKHILALIALPFFLTSCTVVDYGPNGDYGSTGNAGYARQGDGFSITEKRVLNSYTRVVVEAPFHVTIKNGSGYAIYLTMDDNLTDAIRTEAFAGTLTISLSTAIAPTITPDIVVVMPDIRQLTNNGEAAVDVHEDGNFPDLTLVLNGNGSIDFSGTAAKLSAQLNGSGRIGLDGFAAYLNANLRGSGQILGADLLAEDADVNLSGQGNVDLDLDYGSTLNLSLSGAGNVEWWGTPETLNYSLTGSGRVIEHHGLPKRSARTAALAKNTVGQVKMESAREYDTTVVAPVH